MPEFCSPVRECPGLIDLRGGGNPNVPELALEMRETLKSPCPIILKECNLKTRNKMKKILYYEGAALLGMAILASCDKNKGKDKDDDGTDTVVSKQMKNLDVSAYDKWVYVSLEDGTSVAKGIEEAAPEKWDIAMHRENVKTNEGSAIMTGETSFDALTAIPEGSVFMPDELTYTEVAVDMSQMMQGIIIYDTTEINMVLEDWVTRSGMPPVYSVQPNVYVVRTKEGKYAKIQFTSYKGGETGDETGFASFTYAYPVFDGK